MTAASPAQSSFLKALASSDRRIRDRALDNLRVYLRSRNEFSDVELLKLWKGLYFCMWMSDKPRVQQQLARDLAALVEVVPRSTVVPFVDAFWKTMSREWKNIDRLRMDKYLYLIRQYLHVTFRYMAKSGWGDTALVDEFMTIMVETPLDARDARIPNGLRYHMLDIYVDELEKVDEQTDADIPAEQLFAPFITLNKECQTKTIRERAKEVLEDQRVQDWLGVGDGKSPRQTSIQVEDTRGDSWTGIED